MGHWGVTGPLPGPLRLQPGLFMLLSTAFTAAHVLSGMATTRLSGCDMGTSFPPRAVDSVCLVSVFLVQELWLFLWVSGCVGIHAEHLWK